MTNYQIVNDNLLALFLHDTMPKYHQLLSVFFVGDYPTSENFNLDNAGFYEMQDNR
jgi:hypothetical protein